MSAISRLSCFGAIAIALSLPALASAQDFVGNYELTGRYSNRRGTSVQVRIEQSGWDKFRVLRTGKFTSRRYRSRPAFTWTSTEAKRHGHLLVVRYTLGADSAGIVSNLSASSSDGALINALGEENVIRAIYVLSNDDKDLREVAYNLTRTGEESFWRWAKAEGSKIGERWRPTSASGRLTDAEFEAATRNYIRDWYMEYIEDGYREALADADTADERRSLREARENDRDFDLVTEFIEGDEVWEDYVAEAYDDDTKEYYRDAQDRAIPHDDVVVAGFSFFPELAGIGLSKVFVFDRHTGKVIDEGDLQD